MSELPPVPDFQDFPDVATYGYNVSGRGHSGSQIPHWFWSFQTAFFPVPEAAAAFHYLHFSSVAPQIQGQHQAPEYHTRSAVDIPPIPPEFHKPRINNAEKTQRFPLQSARSTLRYSAYFPDFPEQAILRSGNKKFHISAPSEIQKEGTDSL